MSDDDSKLSKDILKNLQDLSHSMNRLKSYAQFANRSRINPSKEEIESGKKLTEMSTMIKEYFYDLLDDGWDYGYDSNMSFYKEINFYKMLKKDGAKESLDEMVLLLNDAKNKLTEYEGYDCHFIIYFNSLCQQELNTQTHKNDIYVFKGIGEDLKYIPSHTSTSWSRGYWSYDPKVDFYAHIKFLIV